MRKSRLVILPTKCLNQIGFLLLFLSCPVLGDWGRIQPESEASHKSIQIARKGTCGLKRNFYEGEFGVVYSKGLEQCQLQGFGYEQEKKKDLSFQKTMSSSQNFPRHVQRSNKNIIQANLKNDRKESIRTFTRNVEERGLDSIAKNRRISSTSGQSLERNNNNDRRSRFSKSENDRNVLSERKTRIFVSKRETEKNKNMRENVFLVNTKISETREKRINRRTNQKRAEVEINERYREKENERLSVLTRRLDKTRKTNVEYFRETKPKELHNMRERSKGNFDTRRVNFVMRLDERRKDREMLRRGDSNNVARFEEHKRREVNNILMNPKTNEGSKENRDFVEKFLSPYRRLIEPEIRQYKSKRRISTLEDGEIKERVLKKVNSRVINKERRKDIHGDKIKRNQHWTNPESINTLHADAQELIRINSSVQKVSENKENSIRINNYKEYINNFEKWTSLSQFSNIKIGDWALNCVVGAVAYYTTTRNVKTA